MAYWFTSDLHFGHENIIKFCNRPWWNVDDMNQGLVDRWNDVVQDGDTVHVLGDMCWGNPANYARYLEQLKGEKFLTPGNHDSCWSGGSKPRGKLTLERLGFKVRPEQWLFYLHGKEQVLCSHFPYQSSFEGDKRDFTAHMPEYDGLWLLHGHVHSMFKADSEHRQVNVGVDVWEWRPVSEGEISEAMAA